jgi:hypothetical protein
MSITEILNTFDFDRIGSHLDDVFESSKVLRSWARTPDTTDGLKMYGGCWQGERADANENFSQSDLRKHLETELAQFVPSLVRLKPEEKPKLPTMLVDEVTGLPAKNPWSEPQDRASQNAILRAFPELAQWLMKTKDGVRAVDLIERAEKQAELARLASIDYSTETHRHNPFTSSERRSEQNQLLRSDPTKAEVYQKEAKPIELPFYPGLNRLIVNQATNANPTVGRLMSQANELATVWRAREMEKAEAARIAAIRRAEELKQTARKFQPVPQQVITQGMH